MRQDRRGRSGHGSLPSGPRGRPMGPGTHAARGGCTKSGVGGGQGWGDKVDGHMPWGALSGSRRVRGHKKVFWARGGGFRAPVVQYMQYMQIWITYIHIHTHTCIYHHIPHIPTHTYICHRRLENTDGSKIQTDSCRYLQIHADTYSPQKYLQHTYTYLQYLLIPT